MISSIFILFFKKLFVSRSIFLKIASELFSIILTIVLIYYAGQAFEMKSVNNSESLFTFLLIGEVSLILGMSFSERWLSFFIDLKNQQFYQTLIGLGLSPEKFAFSRVSVDFLFPVFRVLCILVIGVFIGDLHLSLPSLFLFIFVQFLSIFIYFSMALITSRVYLVFNRGVGFFYTLQTVSSIIAGSYFPISVFPEGLKNFSLFLPHTQILLISRSLFAGEKIGNYAYLTLFFWGLFLFLSWSILNQIVLKNLKQKSRFF